MATKKKTTTAKKKPTVKQVKVEIDLTPKEDGTLPTTEEVIMNAKIEEETKDPKIQILEEFVEYYKKHCEGKTSVKNEIAQAINNYRNAYFGRTERLGNCPACLYKIIKILRKECAKNNISF